MRRCLCGMLGFGLALLLFAASSSGEAVTLETARIVALNKIHHHLALYGRWSQADLPTLGPGRPVHYQGEAVAYLFSVNPGGYVLVSLDDAFSPVPFYAVRSDFDPARAADPNRLEAMVLAQLGARGKALGAFRLSRAAAGEARGFQLPETASRIEKAWTRFAVPEAVFADRTATRQAGIPDRDAAAQRSASPVGPLLTTAWGQGDPYNLMTPENSCTAGLSTDHTLTGCVATAWAQLMKYHEWPVSGSGSHTYWWNGQQLSVDFNVTYDWANMPDTFDVSSTQVEKDAVSQLMYHAGVAAEMVYGCASSGSSAWADEVLDTYFNYKAMDFYSRSSFSASAWFYLFKTEIDADRPVIFSIFAPGIGHEVVVDGYQENADANGTDMVHINFGWTGDDDGYYDVTDDADFNTTNNSYNWYINQQFIVTGIEPNGDLINGSNPRPVVSAGSDQTVREGSTVQLSGSLITPTPAGGASFHWLQFGMTDSSPRVAISNSTSTQASFTAPDVDSDTNLVFMFKATDADRSVGFDKVTVTVRAPSGGGGSSSGGCFLTSLFE